MRGRGRNALEKGETMCANCGCGIPEERHNDERNILWSEVIASADANELTPEEAIENMKEMADREARKA